MTSSRPWSLKDKHANASVETHDDHAGMPRAVVVRFEQFPQEGDW